MGLYEHDSSPHSIQSNDAGFTHILVSLAPSSFPFRTAPLFQHTALGNWNPCPLEYKMIKEEKAPALRAARGISAQTAA